MRSEPSAAGAAPPDDLVQPFQIEQPSLRGRLVRLGAVVDEVLSRHDYPEPVARMLGETLVLAAALAKALKYDGVFTLQTNGDGPITLMVADVTSAGEVRGYAQYDGERLAAACAAPGDGASAGSVPRLLGAGFLGLTVDQGADTDRYQGVVELSGQSLADCAHQYFRQSEQVEAAIKLAVGRVPAASGGAAWRAGALMIQRLPPKPGEGLLSDAAEDDWRRALILMGGSTTEELLDPDLAPDVLLYRLFHEDGVRVYRQRPLKVGCRCSRARVVHLLEAMPRAEVEDMKVGGLVIVTCEFCNTSFTFDEAELAAVYGS